MRGGRPDGSPTGTDLLNGFVRASRDRLNAAARGDRIRGERAAVMQRLFALPFTAGPAAPPAALSVAVGASGE